MLHITRERIEALPFRPCRKTALIWARPLSWADYVQRDGVIQTCEGPVRFRPGDYLAHASSGDWPIMRDEFATHYERVTEPNVDGFAFYRILCLRQAIQISEPFTVTIKCGDVIKGKAGDYLVRSDESAWICDCAMFEMSYEYCSAKEPTIQCTQMLSLLS